MLLAGGLGAAAPCTTFRFLSPADVLTLPSANASVRVADFTGDGRPDVFVLDPTGAAAHVELRQADGTYVAAPSTGTSAAAFVVADVDGDGRPDAVLFEAGGPRLARVRSDGSLQVDAPPLGLPDEKASVFADLDRDGRADLVAPVDGAIWAFRWSAPRGFTASRLVTPAAPAR